MKALLIWRRKLLCSFCHRWRCPMMTRVSGRYKAMPRKFSLASWLHQMTRQHFLKSRAGIKEIIHCSIGLKVIEGSVLVFCSWDVEHQTRTWVDCWWYLMIVDTSGLQAFRISSKVTPGVYGGSVYRVQRCHENESWVVTGRGWFGCFVAHPAVLVTIGLTFANPRNVSYVICVICVLMCERPSSTGWDLVAPRISTMHCPKATHLQHWKTSVFFDYVMPRCLNLFWHLKFVKMCFSAAFDFFF